MIKLFAFVVKRQSDYFTVQRRILKS